MTARKHLGILSFSALLILNGCAPSVKAKSIEAEPLGVLAQDLRKTVACDNSRDQLFEAYYRAYASGRPDGGKLPALMTVASGADSDLQAELDEIHEIVAGRMKSLAIERRPMAEAGESETDPILHLIRLEMRSKIDPVYDEMNEKLDRHLAKAQGLARAQGMGCETSLEAEGRASQTADPHAGDAVYAARRTMATAYQSCQVLDLPPVDNSVEDVQGVVRAVKIDSVGWGRAYRDVALLKRTHYYHRVTRFAGSCVSQDAKPLVYDYGGVPKIVNDRLLNLFVNVGGGPALGIDCSAFVSTSAASAGLRYKEGKSNRAVYTRFLSRDFIDPKKSNWNCFEQVKVTDQSTIRPGDIAAYPGHVVMVDSVGEDPFGLRGVWNASQCDQLNVRGFDFVLIQSSSSKEHLGINRYSASEYLAEGGHMAELFLKHAREACLSKFDRRSRVPSTSQAGLIRHRSTSACLAPRVELAHEDCVASCTNL